MARSTIAFVSGGIGNKNPEKMKVTEQLSIEFNRIKSGISKKNIREKIRMQGKKLSSTGTSEEVSPTDLSSSGESIFFSTTSSR